MSTKKQATFSANEERRRYYKKWRAENRDKIKKYNANYWQRRAEKKAKNQEEDNGKTCI